MKPRVTRENRADRWISSAFVIAATALLVITLVLEKDRPGPAEGAAIAEPDALSADPEAKPSERKLTGTIEVSEKTSLGVVLALRLVSAERTFVLENNARTDQLKAHVGERVTVTARETSAPDGQTRLSVLDFSLGT